jgi:hypothetical protein
MCVTIEEPPAGYDVDEVLAPSGTSRVRRELRRWGLVRRALRDFDVVHFNFGSPLTPLRYPRGVTRHGGLGATLWDAYAGTVELRDLALLKRRGKAVFVTYQGDDARQRGANLELDARRRTWIETFDAHADGIWALNPDLLGVLPARAEFFPYGSVDLEDWTPVEPRTDGPPVIAHAPSDRAAKGTSQILAALDALRADGVEFELALVEGMTRAAARATYERADLLVDQVLDGWYGGVAVELMALGKPVAAYLRAEDLERLPAAMRDDLPVIALEPDGLAASLRPWLTSRRLELPEVGRRSRAYVERWHDPLELARRTRSAYEAALRSRTRGGLRDVGN